MKHSFYIGILAVIILFLSSCTIEKRKYLSGYHVDWKGKSGQLSELTEAPLQEAPIAPHLAATGSEDCISASSASSEALSELAVSDPESSALSSESASTIAHVSFAAERANFTDHKPVKHSVSRVSKSSAHQPISGKTWSMDSGKSNSDVDLIILIILAIIIPPVAVYLSEGSWNNVCWINLILTLLFWLPGVIHALIVVLS